MFIKRPFNSILFSSRKPQDLPILALLVLMLLWQPYYLHQELNLFEWGLYLPGIDAINQGQVPYRDFFHLRGPFELYLPAFLMKVFGFRADVLATYFYIGTLLTILAGVVIAYELIDQRALLYSFVLILAVQTFPRVVFTYWGGMRYAWGLLAIWSLIRYLKADRPGWLIASGCVAAVSLGTSIEIGVLVILAFMSVLFQSRDCRRHAWFFFAGFLLVSLPYAFYLISQNAMGDYLQAQWVVVTHMGKTFLEVGTVPDSLSKFLHALVFPLDKCFYKMTPMYCFMFFLVFYGWRTVNKKISVLDLSVMAVAVYGLFMFLTSIRSFYAAEYEMSLQPEKIVLFYLLGQALKIVQVALPRTKWLGAFLLVSVLISTGIYGIGRFEFRYYKPSWINKLILGPVDPGKESINGVSVSTLGLTRIKGMTVPLAQAQDLDELTRFVDQHVPLHEAILAYPELGSLNFILNRPWVGRFPMPTLTWMNDAWFAEYTALLEKEPPQYAIVNRTMPDYFEKEYFLVPANRIKHDYVMRFLYNHYVVQLVTPNYYVYRKVR